MQGSARTWFGRKARRGEPAAASESVLRAELEMLRAVVSSLPDLIYVKDAESRFLMANKGTAKAMGADNCEELVGKTDFDYHREELARAFYEDEQRIIASGEPLGSLEEQIVESDGRIRYILTTKVPFRDAEGNVRGIIGIGRNITARKEAEAALEQVREELRFKATHDSLTALYNREAILDTLGRELIRARREGGCVTLLMGDLDRFKNINDTHGHPVGDAVLRETARRLLTAVRPYDTVGRYGGEEFLIVLTNCPTNDAMVRAEEIRGLIEATPMETACGAIRVSMSLGVLTTNEWGTLPAEELLREVDVGLYEAKTAGRNRCKLVRPDERSSAHGSNGDA